MLTDAELAGMRETSAGALPDTGTISRPAGTNEGTLNPTTGEWTPTAATPVYEGPMRIRAFAQSETDIVFGGDVVTRQRFIVTILDDAPEVKVGDVVELTTTSDPEAAHRSWRIVQVQGGSFLIDRRLVAETIE